MCILTSIFCNDLIVFSSASQLLPNYRDVMSVRYLTTNRQFRRFESKVKYWQKQGLAVFFCFAITSSSPSHSRTRVIAYRSKPGTVTMKCRKDKPCYKTRR